ncbi:ABC transporter permease [Saccharospirillum salsuginis]|uniref:ABC transporter permease n=1 Tax=Saccharospirillum salsuginis TaxID=418750 RepID=A0A918K1M5_9GAMM|nr:ABC transporter permease [Saccharospirillum salsuginis]GGX42006.1 ABC transporter permease [Saccharospirillum salsuginis]
MRPAILRWFPRLTIAAFLTPVVLGLAGTWLPALGWFPALDQTRLTFAPWVDLMAYPGVGHALRLTLVTGLGSAVLALAVTAIILVAFYPSRPFRRLERLLAPILSVPHAAFAIGIGFLVAPSGWLLRIIETVTGWPSIPPNWLTFKDPWGFSLIGVLALKEIPFLLFMALASLPALKVRETLWLGHSLGYGRLKTWLMLLWPPLYDRLRLPFYAVVAFALSVVDIALIAGPTTPPTLAVLVTRLFNDPDLLLRLPGAAGATLLLLVTVGSLLFLRLLEYPGHRLLTRWLANGRRWQKAGSLRMLGGLSVAVGAIAYAGSLCILLLWSIADRWRYPDALPAGFSLRHWTDSLDRIADPLWLTLSTGLTSAVIALILVIGALENEVRLRYSQSRFNSQHLLWVLYLPLLVPQIAFLFGFQVSLIWLGIDGTWWVLVWSHLVFVLPYTFLTLSGPYRAFDDRYAWVAISLSGSTVRSFWQIKLGMLWRPIAYTLATGFAVSVAQYLPTLFIGGGRFATVTTEAVSLASGSDRRTTAVYALVQQGLPLLGFLLAILLPAWRYRHHRAMQHR